MAGWRELANIWTTFKELDVRPIRDEAERPLLLALVGAAAAGKSTLLSALRMDARARERIISPAVEASLEEGERLGAVDLIILVMDATRADFGAEARLYQAWRSAGRTVVVFYNKMDAVHDATTLGTTVQPWTGANVTYGSALDRESLGAEFVPAVLQALAEQHLALARHYPLFRMAVAREIINEGCLANATFALGTGLAEVIPALDIPFNVADVVILTKNQALMVYRLGLALGLSPRWQDHMTQLGGVVGAGFLWRQVARQLVGLIPVWGILPKVAVAYAGTYAVGQAIVYWYQTGHKISGKGMREVYSEALARGRQVATGLLARTPRPAWPHPILPAWSSSKVKSVAVPVERLICTFCHAANPRDAGFCAYCGKPIAG